MKNPLNEFMTRNEQKILGFLLVFSISGMFLYYTGISSMYADKAESEQQELQKSVQQDSIIRIDIRTANAEELELLPAIGPKRAADIIAYRQQKQFESTEELLNIKGIGAKTFLAMLPMLQDFGTAGAGVTNTAKLQEIGKVAPSGNPVSQQSAKQGLDESEPKINNDSKVAKSQPDDKQGLININSASREELMSLDGIGEVKADAIIAYRKQIGRFTSVEQLMDVKGIGPKTLEKNRHRLSI
jgi:competence protein ComEA